MLTAGCFSSRMKALYESVKDPMFKFNDQKSIGFISIYWHKSRVHERTILTQQQQKDLFGGVLTNVKKEQIFWERGGPAELTQLQEKQMFGYFQSEFNSRGYQTSYIFKRKKPVVAANPDSTAQVLSQENETDEYTNEDAKSLTDKAKDSIFHDFYIPLKTDKDLADSIHVIYEGENSPDLIFQTYFWQLSGTLVKSRVASPRGYSSESNSGDRRTALYIWVDVWAEKPDYKNHVWSGAIIRASKKANLKEQAADMIADLLQSQSFPFSHPTDTLPQLSKQ